MPVNIFPKIKKRIINQFLDETDSRLYYHNQHHTLDVLKQSIRIAKKEGIDNAEDLFLLKTAALYHDIGCLKGHANHEERGCEIMRADMEEYNLSEKQLKVICNLILATKIPQIPKTQLEQILCDADIDYLGRNDFYKFSGCLRREFLAFRIVRDEKHWQETQINFFEKHHYFTATSKRLRNPKKMAYLEELKKEFKKIKDK